jgi:diguanylate cyclase (GGDEF)-like protein
MPASVSSISIAEFLSRPRLQVVYQPIYRLGSPELLGFEALSRFPDGRGPLDWFAAARRCGLLAELDRLAFGSALREFMRAGLPGLLFVNVEGANLARLVSWLQDPELVREAGALLSAGRVVAEVTERDPVPGDEFGGVAEELGRLDVRLAVDDVVWNEAAAGRLRRFRPAFAKLDRSLVARLTSLGLASQHGVARTLALAAELGVALVAEGVTHPSQAAPLVRLGIAYGQGFGLGRPEAADVWAGRAAQRREAARGAAERGAWRAPGPAAAPRPEGSRADAFRALPDLSARWRGLHRGDDWLGAVQNLDRHVQMLTGAHGHAIWAHLPPGGHWLQVSSFRQAHPETWLPPDAEPLATVRARLAPVRCGTRDVDRPYRTLLEDVGFEGIWLLPLVSPDDAEAGEGAAPRRLVGILTLGWLGPAPESPPALDALLPVVAYLLKQRVDGVFTEAGVEWAASQPPPTTGAEWADRLGSLGGWFGGDQWLLLTVPGGEQGDPAGPSAATRPRLVAQAGGQPDLGPRWLACLARPAVFLDSAVHRSASQRRIDLTPDVGDWAGRHAGAAEDLRRMAAAGECRSVLTLPLGASGDGQGVLCVLWRVPAGWRQAGLSVRPWEALRRIVADWWQRMEVARDVRRDPLTGAFNRRGIELAWANWPGEGGVLGIVDCDHFSHVNNTWGHLTGDEVLRLLASVLAAEAEQFGGWCGRFGGDEFVVGLPAEVDWPTFGKRVQQVLDAQARDRGWPARVTLSGGAVRWRRPRPRWEDVLEKADRVLYQAKRRGGTLFLEPRLARWG